MTTTLTFDVPKRNSDPISFDLRAADGGVDAGYVFTPPKRAVMLLPIVTGQMDETDSMYQWFMTGLTPEHRNRILTRLQDDNDDFDYDTVTRVTRQLVEKINGERPTT